MVDGYLKSERTKKNVQEIEKVRKEIIDRHLKRNTRERKSLNKRPMYI